MADNGAGMVFIETPTFAKAIIALLNG